MKRLLYPLVILVLSVLVIHGSAAATDMALDYLYRYNCSPYGVDHLLAVCDVGNNRVVIGGVPGLALVDLGVLPLEGDYVYIHRLDGINSRDLYKRGDYIYANLNANGSGGVYGFSVIRIDGDTLVNVGTFAEQGVFFEKMCIAGDYLYVTAHDEGLRIYDLTDPESPALVGSLNTGFVDAFDVAVSGNTAYIADGAGGLKIVDVTNPALPVVITGETLADAPGTSQAVTVNNGKVYVGASAAGLAIYDEGDISSRELYNYDGYLENMVWVDDLLVISTVWDIYVLDVSGPVPVTVGKETAARRTTDARLRMAYGMDVTDDNRLLCANWDYMDVYNLVPLASSTTPDISPSVQRIRYSIHGGTEPITLYNRGGADLTISAVTPQPAAFTTDYTGGVIPAGGSVTFDLTYDASAAGDGKVLIYSDDPDEAVLPIQVYGQTSYRDPDEMAYTFTLPLISRDNETGIYSEETFTLLDHRGEIIWFQIYGTW